MSFFRHCHPCMLAFLHPLQFDVCGCVGVRAIVAWVATGSTSSECRVRFQAGASSESTGGPVSGIVCCVDFLGDHPVCQRRVGPSVSSLDSLLRDVHVQPACWELFGVHAWEGHQHSLIHCTATAIVAPQQQHIDPSQRLSSALCVTSAIIQQLIAVATVLHES